MSMPVSRVTMLNVMVTPSMSVPRRNEMRPVNYNRRRADCHDWRRIIRVNNDRCRRIDRRGVNDDVPGWWRRDDNMWHRRHRKSDVNVKRHSGLCWSGKRGCDPNHSQPKYQISFHTAGFDGGALETFENGPLKRGGVL